MNKFLVVGDSCSSGVGWNPDNLLADCLDSPHLWINLCHQNINELKNLELVNLSSSGNSIRAIAEQAIDQLTRNFTSSNKITHALFQWGVFYRWSIYFGLELYNTKLTIAGPLAKSFEAHDLLINQNKKITIPKSYISKLINGTRTLQHVHYEILELVKYVNIINRLCEIQHIKMVHVSSRLPWDADYFTRINLTNIAPCNYTEFTKNQVIYIKNRSDEECVLLYNKIHDDYQQAGGIQEATWLNLYKPLDYNRLDNNYDNAHLGEQSNIANYQAIKHFFEGEQ